MTPKFRVWDTVKKSMSEVEAIVYVEEKIYPIYSKVIRRYIPFSEAILMQSTGLFDVNGKEIFEGDVVEVFDSRYTVFYDSENASFRLKPRDKRWNTDYMSNYAHEASFEIIGNIYEGENDDNS
ncbi:YopX family protein [Streptococcus suis]|uniref:YopX family protein n=1 Tax=Streptococcus suis TaxID=1307 RepID=UPI000CF495CE|nr:YopX family protein [Streptococcus suis]